MAHECFLPKKKKVYSGSLYTDKPDLEQCFQDLLKRWRWEEFLMEINLVCIDELKITGYKMWKKYFNLLMLSSCLSCLIISSWPPLSYTVCSSSITFLGSVSIHQFSTQHYMAQV